nr:3-oxoacyl-[acyl-carrier-protein] synthase II, chloroplastic [Tanacetum cinerariifolium]
MVVASPLLVATCCMSSSFSGDPPTVSVKRSARRKLTMTSLMTSLEPLSMFGLNSTRHTNTKPHGKTMAIESFDCHEFPTKIAGEIKSFSADGWVAPKLSRRVDKFILYLITAGKKALEDGGVTEDVMKQLDIARCGVLIGSGIGGVKVLQDGIEALRVSYKKMNPFSVPFATTNMGSAMLAMDLGWMGPNYSISTACATSNNCIINAANHIIRGETDMMLSGGSDAAITPIVLGGFNASNALSERNSDPTKASRPWDVSRDGFVMGEGAGVLLLEELEHAKARGAQIYAEYMGGSFTSDAYHVTQPHPD